MVMSTFVYLSVYRLYPKESTYHQWVFGMSAEFKEDESFEKQIIVAILEIFCVFSEQLLSIPTNEYCCNFLFARMENYRKVPMTKMNDNYPLRMHSGKISKTPLWICNSFTILQ